MALSMKEGTAKVHAHITKFFESPHFAVVWGSAKKEHWGYKTLNWYLNHGLSATPVNTNPAIINVAGQTFTPLPSLSELPNPSQTSVSFVKRPDLTLEDLKLAKQLGVKKVWLQPGTWNDEVLAYAEANFPTWVGGESYMYRGHGGWCVLVDGERFARAAEHRL